MDLADFLMFGFGIYLLVSKARTAKNWRLLWPNSTGLGWLWLVWIVVVAIGLFTNNPVNKDTLEAFVEFRWMLSFQVLCFTLAWVEWDDRKSTYLMYTLLLMVIVSFIFYYFSEDPRAGGPFNHSMPFAHTYGTAFVFISGFVLIGLKNQAPWRWLAITTAIATAVIASLSMTRGVWIGMLAGTVGISLFRSRKYGLILTACLATLFFLTLAYSPVARERTLSTNTSANESDNQRKALWMGNLEIVKDYPFFGTGYSQNKHHLRKYYDKLGFPPHQFISHAHNQFLHIWAGTGTLGLMCYAVFLCTTLLLTVKTYIKLNQNETILRSLTLGSLGAQICFIVASLTESNFSIAKNRYVFLLISAIGVSVYYRFIAKKNFDDYKSIRLNNKS